MTTRIQVSLKKTNGIATNGVVTAAKSGHPNVVVSSTGGVANLIVPVAGPWILTAKVGTLRGGPVIKTAQQGVTVTAQLIMKPYTNEPAVPAAISPRLFRGRRR